MSYQKYICMGNLTRDPDVRYTANGGAVCQFTVACNGQKSDDDVYFADVVVFGKIAESCRQYLTKGSSVLVEGRLKEDKWEDQQGNKHSKTRVYADRVQFVSRGGNNTQQQPQQPQQPQQTSRHAGDLPPLP